MSVLTNLIVADDVDAAVIARCDDPTKAWPGINAKGVDHVKLGKLLSIVAGEPYQKSFIGEFTQLHEETEDGPWVFRIPPRLTEALAGLDDTKVIQVATGWSVIEEFSLDGWKSDDVEAVLKDICALANKAVSENKHILMWMCL